MAREGSTKEHASIPLSAGMLLVTLGVVYGDIGTSPMYVMKAIVNGNGGINSVTEELILGALSLVIWTITLVTTVKYVVVAMKADNLVFLTNDSSFDKLDRDILYSILNKRPKRAKAYWFLNVQVTDEPHTHAYTVNNYGTDFLFKVEMRLGFKVNQRVNAFLRQIVADMVESGTLPPQDHKYSIYRNSGSVGDFRFVMIRKLLGTETELSGIDEAVMHSKYSIRGFCGNAARWYGLENSSIVLEYVPLFTRPKAAPHLEYETWDAFESEIADEGDDEDIISGDIQSELAKVSGSTAELIGGDTASFRPHE
jgi:KUP system potassium uptake protein